MNAHRRVLNDASPDSPVERERKALPKGNGDWSGFAYVYGQISAACERIAQTPYLFPRLSG